VLPHSDGFYICFPTALGVLLLATGSLRVSLYAILAIALVVGSLLGIVKAFFGWSLGTGEGIAGTVVIGLAVDYVVHIASAYAESRHPSREAKVVEAVGSMGVTVIGGAITTGGSALFMYGCQLAFFSKMATLLSGTISLSVLYTFGLFVPLLATVGPSGRIGMSLTRLGGASRLRERLLPRWRGVPQPSTRPPRRRGAQPRACRRKSSVAEEYKT
jgi:protein dispatched 1